MSIFSFVKPYRIPIAIALSLMLVELAVELVQPLLIAKIIDEGIVARDLDTVIKWGGVMLGISFLAFASGITNSFIAAHAGQSFGLTFVRSFLPRFRLFPSRTSVISHHLL
jgi:ATP-binding cassette, subfamily B, multidrug efflux pump